MWRLPYKPDFENKEDLEIFIGEGELLRKAAKHVCMDIINRCNQENSG